MTCDSKEFFIFSSTVVCSWSINLNQKINCLHLQLSYFTLKASLEIIVKRIFVLFGNASHCPGQSYPTSDFYFSSGANITKIKSKLKCFSFSNDQSKRVHLEKKQIKTADLKRALESWFLHSSGPSDFRYQAGNKENQTLCGGKSSVRIVEEPVEINTQTHYEEIL